MGSENSPPDPSLWGANRSFLVGGPTDGGITDIPCFNEVVGFNSSARRDFVPLGLEPGGHRGVKLL